MEGASSSSSSWMSMAKVGAAVVGGIAVASLAGYVLWPSNEGEEERSERTPSKKS
jgi:hypothetical protein